jgi:hypothetical protein
MTIDWARTGSGSLMPVDHDSAGREGGNLAVWREGPRGDLQCRVLKKDEVPGPGEVLGTNHWGTCPQRGKFKRRK